MGAILRVRGILGTGLAWAVAWAPIGAAAGAFAWYRFTRQLPADVAVSPVVFLPLPTVAFAAFGAVSGAVFAITLAITERRQPLNDLSIRQTACLGALGGLTFPGIVLSQASAGLPMSALLISVGLGAGLGAGSAAATVAIARLGSIGEAEGGRVAEVRRPAT